MSKRSAARKKPVKEFLLSLAIVALIVATPLAIVISQKDSNKESHAATLPNNFIIAGYMPSWQGDINTVQYNKLTHIMYAFAIPSSTGNGAVTVEEPTKLSALVTKAHANNVKVSLSVGGWNNGDDSGFEKLSANATTRTAFVNNMISLVNQYGLDGIDIDWEYPDPGASATNYTALMTLLSTELHNRGKLLTAAVVSEGTEIEGVQPQVFSLVDFLVIMAYDGGTPHANYNWSVNGVEAWKARGLPASKTVMGVPFYARPGETFDYKQAVAANPANANVDCATVAGNYGCYNGIPTVQKKTQYMLQNGGGMSFWELSNDTTGSTSLLNAMYTTVINSAPTATPSTGSGPTATPMPTTQPTEIPTPSPAPTSTPLPTPTNAPTPTPVLTTYTIYTDALRSGWANASYYATVNFANTSPVYAGTRSIKFTSNKGWAGLGFDAPAGFTTSGYNYISFAVRATKSSQNFSLYAESSSGQLLKSPVPLSNYGGYPSTTSWKVYKIPLSAINAANKGVGAFTIQNNKSYAQSAIYVDQVQLVK